MAPKIVGRFRLHTEPGSFASASGGLPSNKDLDPVPFESDERTWTWPSLLGFWVAEAFSISMYQVASSSITKGLSPGLAITAVLVGHLLVCIPAMLNGYIGCIYGINFPVLMRSTFGVYGAYFAVFVRGVVACICKCCHFPHRTGIDSFRVWNSKFPRRSMHSDNAASDLAVFQRFPKSYSSQCSCHLGADAVLLPLHHNPATPTLAACIEVEISVHGKDDRNAYFWNDSVYLGFGRW